MITKLDWKPSYSVGVKLLDEQHKRLLELINDLTSENPDHSMKRCFAILNELINYAQLHFSTEEALLENLDYRELYSHRQEHAAFTDKIFDLNQQLSNKGVDIFPMLTMFLKDWYIAHILGTDRNYISLFEKKEVK